MDSQLEELFLQQVQGRHLPEPIPQYAFQPSRKWRFDFAWPNYRLAAEIQGGTWNGGHSRGRAISREYEKFNAAQNWGWRVLLFDTVMVREGLAIDVLSGSLGVTFTPLAFVFNLPKKRNAKEKKGT